MTEAERLGLAHRDDAGHAPGLLNRLEFGVAALAEGAFEFGGNVEVVLHRCLAARGDEDDALDACLGGLLDGVLEDGSVDEGEHLLGNGLGDGEEARAYSGGGDDGGTDWHDRERIAGSRRVGGEAPR